MTTLVAQNYNNPLENKSQKLDNHLSNAINMTNRLCQRYDQLLRSEKYYDCVFHVGTKSLKCHKLILSAASPVFEAMFYGPIREKNQEIEILDISADVFYTFLSYIYTGRVDFEQLSLEESIELYYGAEKYLLTELIEDCLTAIKRKLRFVNILPALELSVCMNLQPLLEICLGFFARCCLSDPQYMAFLKHNYIHVSKDCIKMIIATNQELKHLLWYVFEWCEQECIELGLQKSDCKMMINDLQLSAKLMQDEALLNGRIGMGCGSTPSFSLCKSLERSYYKACRPFNIDYDAHEWHVSVKCDRFISLMGIIINSRLTPSPITLPVISGHMSTTAAITAMFPTEYNENLQIEIRAKKVRNNFNGRTHGNSDVDDDYDVEHHSEQEESDSDSSLASLEHNPIIWRYALKKHPTKYNCDLHIQWDEDVILSPDVEYQIKLIWDTDAYGAEYPCSLQSNEVEGITFKDFDAHCGSLIKGLRFLNLV